MDIVAALPWPAGMVLGIVAFLGIRYGVPAYISSTTTGMFRQLGPALSKSLPPIAWFALIACWIAAGYSFLKAQHRKKLLATQTGLDSIAAMDWRDFERLVGEAFRRRGYTVEETGLGGADGESSARVVASLRPALRRVVASRAPVRPHSFLAHVSLRGRSCRVAILQLRCRLTNRSSGPL